MDTSSDVRSTRTVSSIIPLRSYGAVDVTIDSREIIENKEINLRELALSVTKGGKEEGRMERYISSSS